MVGRASARAARLSAHLAPREGAPDGRTPQVAAAGAEAGPRPGPRLGGERVQLLTLQGLSLQLPPLLHTSPRW